jgi:hypothetical protein
MRQTPLPIGSLVQLIAALEINSSSWFPEGVRFVPIRDRRILCARRSRWRGGRRHADWIVGVAEWLVAAAMRYRSTSDDHTVHPPTWAAYITALDRYSDRHG